jgi:hypothetical protein
MPAGTTMAMQDPAAIAVQEKTAEQPPEKPKSAAKRKAKAKVTA